MKPRITIYALIAALAVMIFGACNNESDTFTTEVDSGNCAVTSFSLVKDDSVLTALDSVFFSIDLVSAEIYNADSLPRGTDVSKLIVSVGTASVAVCDITFRIYGTERDTTISYIDSPTDSINFSDGPVKMFIRSYDGLNSRTYNIKVNVHESDPDTLFWATSQMTAFPVSYTPSTQFTFAAAEGDNPCYTYIPSQSSATVGTLFVTDTQTGDLTEYISDFRLPDGGDPKSLYQLNADNFVNLSSDGWVYKGTSGAWTQLIQADYVYGVVDGVVYAARKDSSGWVFVTNNSESSLNGKAVPSGCPVSGTGQLVSFTSIWSSNAMAVFLGGRDADGNLSGDTWGFDGSSCAKISNTGIDPREGVCLVAYTIPTVDTSNWEVEDKPALLAMGGLMEDEDGNDTLTAEVYVSYDLGITWKLADDWLQLPDYLGTFCNAQAFVVNNTMYASGGSMWTDTAVNKLPAWARAGIIGSRGSRVVTAPTEWECPYIYLYGGESLTGTLHNTVWRGVINRFTFKPLY